MEWICGYKAMHGHITAVSAIIRHTSRMYRLMIYWVPTFISKVDVQGDQRMVFPLFYARDGVCSGRLRLTQLFPELPKNQQWHFFVYLYVILPYS